MPEPTKVIEVVPYDIRWKDHFNKISNMITGYIGDLIEGVEHVGSTAVEGLYAKPIIDIDVVIENYDMLPKIIERLELEGFIHEGNLGIEGREAFKRKYDDKMMKYHLYVCPKDGKGYLEHIALRDYLKANEHARDEYSRIKIQLAKKYRYDIESYCDKKTDFIQGILDKTLYKGNSNFS